MIPTIPSAYHFGQLVPLPDRPEPPRADPRLDRLLRSELLARYGWSEADADAASGFGLPKARGRVTTAHGHLGESFYSAAAVNAWAEALGRLAAQVAPTTPTGRVRKVIAAALGAMILALLAGSAAAQPSIDAQRVSLGATGTPYVIAAFNP